MTIPPHLASFEWLQEQPEQTITIVKNGNIKQPKGLIELVFDHAGRHFEYQQNQSKSFEEIFNCHEDVFYIGCKQVAPDTYVLLENNGYYANQTECVEKLCVAGSDDASPVAVSVFWNVNAHYRLMVATQGVCIMDLDPFGMSGQEMVEYNEATGDFEGLWRWSKEPFEKNMMENDDYLVPGMLWLAELVTGYRLTPDIYSGKLEHIGHILEPPKEGTAPKKALVTKAVETGQDLVKTTDTEVTLSENWA
eukprot:Protomagalhaensia_wolfi_Nauph_80__2424@NODE_25_length_4703_cov_54_878859_g20_i0_p4_GENE_NODE_25_length_4703_cov_54_878859_g20_i0NODE_25_length_4703_cov_54_878859_g20_i0_p4_ORF_typecomplete_len250_score57_99FAM35_C/PF15793_5/0_17_NODE_25_length_4703_cov_54_878859_g20_i011981947